MKTLKEIKDEYAFERGYENFRSVLFNSNIDNQLLVLNEISRRYAIEVATHALNNAADNAVLGAVGCSCEYFCVHEFVDKESILNESNIPNLD